MSIRLINKGSEDSLIEFRPRYKSKDKIVTRKLVYGHYCDWCSNVIQAMFLTDEEIRLYPYEETRVISQGDKNEGNLLKIIPNPADRDSAYRVDMYRTKGGTGQLIRLKNHVLRWEGIGSSEGDQLFEVGERCCKYAGLYTRNEAEIVNEAAIACGYNRDMYVKSKVNIPLSYLSEWKPSQTWNNLPYKLVPAIGKGNTMMMLTRTSFKANTYAMSGFIDLYESWSKKIAQEALEATIDLGKGE